MTESIARLPLYLQRYCSTQDYEQYTEEDHAVWRYIMRQNRSFFRRHGHPIYDQGLALTGIPLGCIPRISDMDKALKAFGWGAVPVCGFIPPSVFIEFQARRILPIATDMRTIEHVGYTPAPDIVHEAAGHAPLLVDKAYSDYLCSYGVISRRAISSKEDIAVYEAIRYLSDLKEDPAATPDAIQRAEIRLQSAVQEVREVSEAAKLARLFWWTVEYGLVGSIRDPKIYGAGLLSSVMESQALYSDHVRKVPLSAECVETGYDITKPQPQLFVVESLDDLVPIVDELAQKLAYAQGGQLALERSLASGSVTTVELDTGLQISGILSAVAPSSTNAAYLRFSGPCALAVLESELPNQGTSRHPQGFSTVLGRLRQFPETPIADLNSTQLAEAGLQGGAVVDLKTTSGYRIQGRCADILRNGKRIVLITLKACTVEDSQGNQLFCPDWGDFDWAPADCALRTFGGAADREKFEQWEAGTANSRPGGNHKELQRSHKRPLELMYRQLRDLRQSNDVGGLQRMADSVSRDFPLEWLLHLEILEQAMLSGDRDLSEQWLALVNSSVSRLRGDNQQLLLRGIQELASRRPN